MLTTDSAAPLIFDLRHVLQPDIGGFLNLSSPKQIAAWIDESGAAVVTALMSGLPMPAQNAYDGVAFSNATPFLAAQRR
ncbi:hypothetical protein AAGS40_07400 [Paraburkholderia sp. PREW-6R]|uniref:hypothetical protein n=1 Tax=Paraburkholderia sp. PREW-6R TaxID=3141544 RepID=UPI0031F4C726